MSVDNTLTLDDVLSGIGRLPNVDELDRAIADSEEEGYVKIRVREGSDHILGATIVTGHAAR